METKDGIGLLGGYAAKQCPELTRKDFSHEYDNSLKADPSPILQAMFDAGNAFEARLIEELKGYHAEDDGVRILDGVEDRDDKAALKAWASESMELFRNPDVWFIVNPRLEPVPELNLTGEPDAAIRGVSGDWHAVDFKDHREMEGSSKASEYQVSTLDSPGLDTAVPVAMTGKPQLDDSMQLAHYHRMFEAHGFAGNSSEIWGAIVGRTEQLVWRRLDLPTHRNARLDAVVSPLEYYDVEQEYRRAIRRREKSRRTLPLGIVSGPDMQPLSAPEWKGACKDCPWRNVCHEELQEQGDISLLPGITPTKAAKYRAHDVNTDVELAHLHHPTAVLSQEKVDVAKLRGLAKGSPAVQLQDPSESLLKNRGAKLERITSLLHSNDFRTVSDLRALDERTSKCVSEGATGIEKAIDQARVHLVGNVHLARGSKSVGFDRASIEVDIDFEDHAGYTYMFGLLITKRSPDREVSEYKAFCSWDESSEGEAKAFADFWNELMRLKSEAAAAGGGFRAYHYTPHEIAAIKTLAKRHEGLPGVPTLTEVTNLMTSQHWIDLYPVISKDTVWPTADYTVKSIAKYAGHSWSGDGVNGALSIVWYQEVLNHPDPAVREERKEALLTYNRQDNEATLKIRDWITALSESELHPGDLLPNVADLDASFNPLP